jgi:hypothetical protein
MKSTKDDSPLKARFFAVRKEIYNLYKENQQTEQKAASVVLKRVCQSVSGKVKLSRYTTTSPLRVQAICSVTPGSKVIMGLHLLSTKSIYRNLFVNTEMETWVESQKPQTQDKFRKEGERGCPV